MVLLPKPAVPLPSSRPQHLPWMPSRALNGKWGSLAQVFPPQPARARTWWRGRGQGTCGDTGRGGRLTLQPGIRSVLYILHRPWAARIGRAAIQLSLYLLPGCGGRTVRMNQAPGIPTTPEPDGHLGRQPSSRNGHDQVESQRKVRPLGC